MYQSTHTGAQVDEAIDKALGADAVPTPGSTNLVESGGVFAALSNRNLLDNGWFTVNQRGTADATTVSGNGYFADRWQATGSGVQRVAGGGINILGVAYHKLDNPGIEGKTVTLSLLYSDGEISSNTFEWTGTTFAKTFKYGTANIYPSANQINVGAQSVNVTAIKLELGSVSTLANDAPPNYAEELAKCQRYAFVPQISSGAQYLAWGFNLGATASSTLNAIVQTPVVMRTTPTVSGTLHSIRGNGNNINSGISIGANPIMVGNNVLIPINTGNSFAALTTGWGVLFSSLILSADL